MPTKNKLCIDPGHGFGNRIAGKFDSGAVSNHVQEADVVLAFALTIKYVFQQAGIEIFLTRDDSSDVTPVGQRDNQATAAGCTHFLALHLNDGGGQGTETYYRDPQDRAFASLVQVATLHSLGLRDRGLKLESASQHTRLAVFDFPGPAALVELGFVDSDRDRAVLTSRDYRVKFANALLEVWQAL